MRPELICVPDPGAAKLPCIPKWYRKGMSKQIAVRLPTELVDFVDRLVADGAASSRAAVVARALDRERRREVALVDAGIMASSAPDPDMDALATYAERLPLGLD